VPDAGHTEGKFGQLGAQAKVGTLQLGVADGAASKVTPEQMELARLRTENARLRMERDIAKKSGGVLRSSVRLKYAFIAKHQSIYSVTRMCRVLRLHPSGYYAWQAQLQSQRAIDDQRLLLWEVSVMQQRQFSTKAIAELIFSRSK
jgi:hypothetical protein